MFSWFFAKSRRMVGRHTGHGRNTDGRKTVEIGVFLEINMIILYLIVLF
ncbi:hypothetical protein Belba_3645 [Belliella baltica DSM 15883]|uniref:Uncharacterized protein n=1 Tax=Belliella baltica (strain DSM 15883 / CIP 108006 / LMG 21964 / BA134) TaxID=866536 RepID=I3ZA69_BELBD|nr:hypothetical protein Belba_3645 [Belliella baltica DSM 15883]